MRCEVIPARERNGYPVHIHIYLPPSYPGGEGGKARIGRSHCSGQCAAEQGCRRERRRVALTTLH